MNCDDLHVDAARLADICRKYRVARLEAFGSFAAARAGQDSDLDLLVTFGPDAQGGLAFVALHQALEGLFGRGVDLLTRRSVETSPNKYFRRFALRHTRVLYDRAA